VTVIIRPDEGQSARDLIVAVAEILGERVRFGDGGVVLTEVQAHTYLSALLETTDTTGEAPAPSPRKATKAAPAKKTAARARRTARGTGE
jgi:hypothetical protein